MPKQDKAYYYCNVSVVVIRIEFKRAADIGFGLCTRDTAKYAHFMKGHKIKSTKLISTRCTWEFKRHINFTCVCRKSEGVNVHQVIYQVSYNLELVYSVYTTDADKQYF